MQSAIIPRSHGALASCGLNTRRGSSPSVSSRSPLRLVAPGVARVRAQAGVSTLKPPAAPEEPKQRLAPSSPLPTNGKPPMAPAASSAYQPAAPSSTAGPSTPAAAASLRQSVKESLASLPTADTAISPVARILVSTFSLLLFYGSMLSSLLNASFLPLAGGLVLGGLLLFSAFKPMRAQGSEEPSKLLSAVLGFLGFTSLGRVFASSSPAPLLGLPPFLVLTFCVASYVVFLHPAQFYKQA